MGSADDAMSALDRISEEEAHSGRLASGLSSDQLQVIVSWAERTPCIREVRLFGSRAKGTARSDSEIELAVELEGGVDEQRSMYDLESGAWRAELTDALALRVEVEWCHETETPSLRTICEEASTLLFSKPLAG